MKEIFLKRLNLIWFALLGGQVMFLGVVLLVFKGQLVNPELQGLLDYVAVVVLFPAVFMSQFLYKQAIQKIKGDQLSPQEKLTAYQTATIIKGALLEGSNLFCIVAYMLTNTHWLVIVIVAVLGFFFTQKPSLQKFDTELEEDFKI